MNGTNINEEKKEYEKLAYLEKVGEMPSPGKIKNSRNKKILIIIGVFIAILSFTVGALSNGSLSFSETAKTSELNNTCSNLSLNDTTSCLQNALQEWYSYNKSNIYKQLTDEELKTQGGVCWHYADWYKEQAKNLGFYTKEVTIDVNETLAHVFTVVSNDKGYCILDQTSVKCQNLNN